MPSKDIKVNGQIMYALERQKFSSELLKMNNSKSRFIGNQKSVKLLPFGNAVIYASCFKDGVYRYPTNFDDSLHKRQYQPNAPDLPLSRIPGKKHFNKFTTRTYI